MTLQFSPDGTHLAVATPNNGTVVWDIIKKSVLLQTSASAYTALNFSACGMLLATGAENTITLWQEGSKKWESIIEQDSRITWIDFYDPTTLLVGFSDGTLLLFDTKNQKEVICESRVHKQAVLFAIRNPAMEIVSVGKDKRIVLTQIIYPEYAKPYFEVRRRRRRKVAKEMTAYIGKARNAIVFANQYGGVEYLRSDLRRRKDTLFMGRWRSAPVATAEVFRPPEYFHVTALNVSYNSSKEQIYLGFQNGGISIGHLHRKRFTLKAELMTVDPMEGAVTAIAGSVNGDLLAAATDRQVTLYDLTTLECLGPLPDV